MVTINLDSYDLAPTVREDLECIAQHDGVISEEDGTAEHLQMNCISKFISPYHALHYRLDGFSMSDLLSFCEIKENEKKISDRLGWGDVSERKIAEYRVDPILREGTLFSPEPAPGPRLEPDAIKMGQVILDDGRAYDLYYFFGWCLDDTYCLSEDGFSFVYDEKTKMYRLYHPDGVELKENHPGLVAYIPSTGYGSDNLNPSQEGRIGLNDGIYITTGYLTKYIRLQDEFRHQASIQVRALSELDDKEILGIKDSSVVRNYQQLHPIVEEREALLRIAVDNSPGYANKLRRTFSWPSWVVYLPTNFHKYFPRQAMSSVGVMEHVTDNPEMQRLQDAFQATCIREQMIKSVPDDALFRISLAAAGLTVDTLPEDVQNTLFTHWSRQCNFDPDQMTSGRATIEFLLSDTVRERENQSLRWQCYMDSSDRNSTHYYTDSCGRRYSFDETPTGGWIKVDADTTPYESCVPPLPVIQNHYLVEGLKTFVYGLFEGIIPEKYKPQGPNDDYMSCLDGIVRE